MADDLNSLAVDLAKGGVRVGFQSVAVVQRGCGNIQRDARAFASGMSHLRRYPDSITFDVQLAAGGVVGEVGPEVGRGQGSLGHLVEYGSPTSGPNAHMGPALDREGPRFVKAVEDLAGGVL